MTGSLTLLTHFITYSFVALFTGFIFITCWQRNAHECRRKFPQRCFKRALSPFEFSLKHPSPLIDFFLTMLAAFRRPKAKKRSRWYWNNHSKINYKQPKVLIFSTGKIVFCCLFVCFALKFFVFCFLFLFPGPFSFPSRKRWQVFSEMEAARIYDETSSW